MSANNYIKNVCDRVEKLLKIKLKNYGSPLDAVNRLEMEFTDLLLPYDISTY